MFHLYRVDNGVLISSASSVDNIPDGMAVKESDKKGVWDTVLLDFVEPEKDTILNKDDYLDLFTDNEILNIVNASKTDDTVKAALDILNFRGRIRLKSQNTINSVNYMQSIGLLENENRAEEILNA